MNYVFGSVVVLLLALVYFAPSLVAFDRKHHARASIVVVNLFFGWTLLGWVASLAWAVGPVKKGSQ